MNKELAFTYCVKNFDYIRNCTMERLGEAIRRLNISSSA
jgi:hypothetical protein